MTRNRLIAVTAAAALGAGGLGAGLALSLGAGTSVTAPALKPASAKASFAYYATVVRRYAGGPGEGYGSMMGGRGPGGGGYAWMMGQSGYAWMMGGSSAPGWMTGGLLPASMMGAGQDPGEVMGSLFADAPGPRVSPSQAARLGNEVPSGATVDQATKTITFSGRRVDFAVLASPSMPAENFKAAGLTDPTIVVPLGAHVQVELVNADDDMAHGLVISNQRAASSAMPMMSSAPAFSGAALWFLGGPTSAGMHAGTLSFTASTAGTYSYFCPVPGHAAEGMVGSFVVEPATAP
ncbi:MAG: sulfocyanin-like copper-binding protein [Acidimicrobiales bacterium]